MFLKTRKKYFIVVYGNGFALDPQISEFLQFPLMWALQAWILHSFGLELLAQRSLRKAREMSFADVESERERVPLELFSAQKLRKATDELSLLPKFPDFVLQLGN